MAKVVTQTIAINVSRLLKDSEVAASAAMVSDQLVKQLEDVVSELIEGVIVEALLVE